MSAKNLSSINKFREYLYKFWEESLEVEPIRDGFLFTMPFSYPDGWQIVLELTQKTPETYCLSDRGKTLSWLEGRGQNLGTKAVQKHLRRLLKEHSITLNHGILERWLEMPLDAIDIQVFAEGITAISRLEFLYEYHAPDEGVVASAVNKILEDAQLKVERNYKLNMTSERAITVDYFAKRRKPMALQLLRNRTDLLGTMEKWGYRWQTMKGYYRENLNEDLVSVMLYDGNALSINRGVEEIGEKECDLFCEYNEVERVHEFLESV